MGRSRRLHSALAVGVLAVAATGCSGPTLQESLSPGLGQAGCNPASPAAGPDQNFEIIGTPLADAVSASGLFFQTDSDDAQPGERKFVVRVTGEGELQAELLAPNSEPADLAWGPLVHTENSFEQSGDELAMGMILGEPGCWQLQLSRDGEPTAAFWFDVQ